MTDQLEEREALALAGGGVARIAKQHAAGKLTARERLELLLDIDSFTEIDQLVRGKVTGADSVGVVGDGVVIGAGKIDGRPVCVYSQDFTVLGGSLGAAHASKIVKIMDLALKIGAPIIGLSDSGGARIQEGVAALGGYADIFYRNTLSSGVIPQISCVMGPCAGGAVYSPAITDFTFMVEDTSYMFITGPDVIRAVTHEDVTKEELGGASAHSVKSGVAHFTSPDDAACLARARQLFSYLPLNNLDGPPNLEPTDPATRLVPALESLIPAESSQPYDMAAVLREVLDKDSYFEVQAAHARNILIGFGRLAGKVVGVVANQPSVLAGVLDIAASIKAARFVRFCDAFGIPLLCFVDVPGFLPGVEQEHRGIIVHGAKLLYAFAEATVPKLTVITRKAYGGAYDVMNSKHIGADVNLALPGSEIAVMGSEGAVNILHRQQLAEHAEPDVLRSELTRKYREQYANPYLAAELGFIDEVVRPPLVRRRLAECLELLKNKRDQAPRRKHGNIPL